MMCVKNKSVVRGFALVVFLLLAAFATQTHPFSEVAPIDNNLDMSSYDVTGVGYFYLGSSSTGCIKQWDGNSWEDQICLPYGGTDVVLADTAGSVGVGTTPGEKLDVAGDIQARSHLHSGVIDTTQGRLYLYSGNADDNYDDPYIQTAYDNDGHFVFVGGNADILAAIGLDEYLYLGDIGGDSWTWRLGGDRLESANGNIQLIDYGNILGNLGIGTNSPTGVLDVDGGVLIGDEGIYDSSDTIVNIGESLDVDGEIGIDGYIYDIDDGIVNIKESVEISGSLSTNNNGISDRDDAIVNIKEGLQITGDLTVSGGDLQINKESGWSVISFPATVNDPGAIQHYESADAARIEIIPGDDASGDYVVVK